MEPLDPVIWLESLKKLRAACEQADPLEDRAHVRQAFHLLRLAPAPLREMLEPAIDEPLFETVLAQSTDLAALALLGNALEYELTQHGPGADHALALRLPGASVGASADFHSLPQVVVIALCSAIIALSSDESPT